MICFIFPEKEKKLHLILNVQEFYGRFHKAPINLKKTREEKI
jgi:hypothetical protein